MSDTFVFGEFRFEAGTGLLCGGDGKPVPLGMPARRLLAILLERAGISVPKAELIRHVWGHAAIGDNALHVHMTLLRRAVGDACIVTKQGLGYRFAAPVRRAGAASPSTAPAAKLRPHKPQAAAGRVVGRTQALRDLSRLMTQQRLVTLVGPGGVGKTWLMHAAAEAVRPRFADGVWLVELAAVNDAALVAGAVGSVLGLEIADASAPANSLAVMASTSALLLLDNCEHVLAAAASVAEALCRAVPGLHVLATSRTPLGCQAEHVFPVPPLALSLNPSALPAEIRKASSVELFLRSAAASDPAFRVADHQLPLVASMCARVDGLPLAIQMVASWAPIIGIDALEAKLAHAIASPSGPRGLAPERHSTLRATFDWSYDLLPPHDREILCRLAVFADRFTLEAAEQVAAGGQVRTDDIWSALCHLVRQSLLVVERPAGTPRYRMLETTRIFALEKRDAEPGSEVVCALRDRHAAYVLAKLELAEHDWESTGDSVWLERYAPLLPDLRASLDWAMRGPGQTHQAAALAAFSWPLWRELSVRVEGGQRIDAVLAALPADIEARFEISLRQGMGDMLSGTAGLARARAEFTRVAALCRAGADQLGLGRALTGLGYVCLILADLGGASVLIDEACAVLETGQYPRSLAAAVLIRIRICAQLGDYDAVPALKDRCARLHAMAGADRSALFLAAHMVEVAVERARPDEAIMLGHALVEKLRQVERQRLVSHGGLLAGVLANLAAAHVARGELDQALDAARQAVPLLRDKDMLFWLFDHLTLLAARDGRLEDAALLAGYTEQAYQRAGYPRQPSETQAQAALANLLRACLPAPRIRDMARLGAMMTEDRAIDLALSPLARLRYPADRVA